MDDLPRWTVWLVGPAVLGLAALAALAAGGTDVVGRGLAVVGRLHMAAVHLPVGLLAGALLLELPVWRRDRPSAAAAGVVWLGAALAWVTASLGWLHAAAEAIEGTGVLIHRSLALVLLVTATATAELGRRAWTDPGWLPAYRSVLVGCSGLAVVVAHSGGTLVHGKGWLVAPWREATAVVVPRTPPAALVAQVGAVDFERDVAPLFEDRCYRCHGPTKQKARLRLDRPRLLFRGEEADWLVRPGAPEDSELIRRVELPEDHEDVMPNEGDALTLEQIALLRAWVAQGASIGTP